MLRSWMPGIRDKYEGHTDVTSPINFSIPIRILQIFGPSTLDRPSCRWHKKILSQREAVWLLPSRDDLPGFVISFASFRFNSNGLNLGSKKRSATYQSFLAIDNIYQLGKSNAYSESFALVSGVLLAFIFLENSRFIIQLERPTFHHCAMEVILIMWQFSSFRNNNIQRQWDMHAWATTERTRAPHPKPRWQWPL